MMYTIGLLYKIKGNNMFEIDESIDTLTLDHHGIVAGVCKELKIAEIINSKLNYHPDRVVSPGDAVVAMIINGLGFSNRRLYLTHQFFQNKPIDLFLGNEITAKDITDYTLGHTLDDIYKYGSSQLFADVSFTIALENNLLGSNLHLDTTSISVNGEYKSHDGDEQVIEINHGYSKDMRQDLKQFVLSLVVSGESNIPIFMETLDGNSSDQVSFHETVKKVQEFKEQIKMDQNFKWVADSAFYNADKLLKNEYLWLTRVPEKIKEASALVKKASSEISWITHDEDYKYCSFISEYGGVKQRWLLVSSMPAYNREIQTFENKLNKQDVELKKDLWHLSNKIFNCEQDAKKEVVKIIVKFKYHKIEYTITEVLKYQGSGKPKKTDKKVISGYKIESTFMRDNNAIDTVNQSKGRFILATNDLDKISYPDQSMLIEYKKQQGVEMGFKFLKDPWFMADSVFLKSNKRIEALMMVMTLCLLVYNYAQFKVRQSLKDTNSTLPNQIDKEVKNPTLKWLFQLMEDINIVRIWITDVTGGKYRKILTNITKLRQRILFHLGSFVCEMYGINHKNLKIGLGM